MGTKDGSAGSAGGNGGRQWAVCCSGGGIRSAAFCLGGLQRLADERFPLTDSMVVGVSGGSYIAGARALAADRHLGNGKPYALGSAEEHRLRNNTRYLAPDGRTRVIGLLSLLWGAVVISVVMLAPVLVGAYAWGWLLRSGQVLTPAGLPGASNKLHANVTAHWWWVASAVTAVAVVVAFVLWRNFTARSRWPVVAFGWTAVLFGVTVLATLVVPLLVQWLSGLGSSPDALATGGWHWVPPSIVAVTSAFAALGSTLLGWASAVSKKAGEQPGWVRKAAGKVGGWFARLLPWLGVVVIVLVTSIAALAWIQHGAQRPWSGGTTILFFSTVGFVLVSRFIVDWNRLSMHDFYAWRLTDGYDPGRGTDAPGDRQRPAQAGGTAEKPAEGKPVHQTNLSELGKKARKLPPLLIVATANITAHRERPPGQEACCLTFDPENVRLWTPSEDETPSQPWTPSRAGNSNQDGNSNQPGAHGIAEMHDLELVVGPKRLTLFDLIAISGAAIAPLMGRMTRAPFRLPMVIANVRLGVWLPHPDVVAAARRAVTPAGQPGEPAQASEPGERRSQDPLPSFWAAIKCWLWYVRPHGPWRSQSHKDRTHLDREGQLWGHLLYLRLIAEPPALGAGVTGAPDAEKWRRRWAGLRAGLWYRLLQPNLALLWAESVGHLSYRQTWLYATDGGHYDNLGLVAALQQGVDDVLVLDASGDPPDHWSTIGQAEALARVDAGTEIELDPSRMRPPVGAAGGRPALAAKEVVRPWATGTFAHNGRHGQIYVCKLGWWHDASWDIRAYAADHLNYPTTSTAQQLYQADEFEAYRALGYQAVDALYAARRLPCEAPTPRLSQVR